MEPEVRAIYDKCTDVISSCRNRKHIKATGRYKNLAIKRILELSDNPVVDTIVHNINLHFKLKVRHL